MGAMSAKEAYCGLVQTAVVHLTVDGTRPPLRAGTGTSGRRRMSWTGGLPAFNRAGLEFAVQVVDALGDSGGRAVRPAIATTRFLALVEVGHDLAEGASEPWREILRTQDEEPTLMGCANAVAGIAFAGCELPYDFSQLAMGVGFVGRHGAMLGLQPRPA